MTTINRTPLQAAEASIAEILRELEADTGQIVDAIRLESIEVTEFGDDRPQHQMHVSISLKRLPGHNWAT